MHKPVEWQTFTKALDVSDIDVPLDYLCSWVNYTSTTTGLVFQCQSIQGRTVNFYVDVYDSDTFRFQFNPNGLQPGPSELLISSAVSPSSFHIETQDDLIALVTDRVRVEFQRSPWQVRAYAVDTTGQSEKVPFYRQRIDDRAYGPGYEVVPTGFEPLPNGQLGVRETVSVQPGEGFYGFGEKFTRINKWGQELVSWAVDCGNVSSHRSYKNVPFFMSTAGYGLFIHSTFPIVYRMGSESSISYSFHIEDSQLDYFLFFGPSFKHILKQYTRLTGRAPVPPKWSFGFWMSRAGYRSRSEVESVAKELRRRDFPCDVISLDPWWMGDSPWCSYQWDERAFPEPADLIRQLRSQGLRTCLWITPYIPFGSQLFEEGKAKGYFIRKPDGNIAPVLEAFAGGELAAVDFTNPRAKEWFQSKLSVLLNQGVAVFKTDFGEQAPVEAVYHDGRSGLEMHNLYPLLYNQAVFELTQRHYGRGLVWGRSGYAGSQRYPVQWGGDSYSSLDQLACQVQGLLSYGLSGVPFCSHDVGGFDYSPGFFDHFSQEDYLKSFDQAEKENYPKDTLTYIRWLQAGVFSSHVRAHGKQPHEPWTYGEQAEAISRNYLKLRYRLMPYIYCQAVLSSLTGLPMVRPMVLEFQDDPTTWSLDQQYLFGDSFLVAPVLRPDNRCLVYLPRGQWVNYWTKQVEGGGRWLELEAPLDQVPLWVRAGSIIPLDPDQSYVEEKPLDPLTLEFYAPQDRGETTIYDEDQSDIFVRYWREAQALHIDVSACAGQVQIVVFGLNVRAAHTGEGADASELPLIPCAGGWQVTLDGRHGAKIIFSL